MITINYQRLIQFIFYDPTQRTAQRLLARSKEENCLLWFCVCNITVEKRVLSSLKALAFFQKSFHFGIQADHISFQIPISRSQEFYFESNILSEQKLVPPYPTWSEILWSKASFCFIMSPQTAESKSPASWISQPFLSILYLELSTLFHKPMEPSPKLQNH